MLSRISGLIKNLLVFPDDQYTITSCSAILSTVNCAETTYKNNKCILADCQLHKNDRMMVVYPWLRVEIPEIKIGCVGDFPTGPIHPMTVEPLNLEIDGHLSPLATAKGHGLAKLAPQLPIGSRL